MNGNSRFFVSVPKYSELCCLKCQAHLEKIQNSICKTTFHAKILMCRTVIHTLPEVIASPISSCFFNVIMTAEYYKTKKVQDTLNRFNITFEEPKLVSLKEYAACLKYTINFKMATSWNQVDRYLIKGRYFLHEQFQKSNTSAVLMNISVDSEKMILDLHPVHIQMFPIKIERQLKNFGFWEQFMENLDCTFEPSYFRVSLWVFVLPSMNRAQVISISKTIPEASSFKTYSEIYSHWKNMYGYILPKDSKGILYYTLRFSFFPENYFVYPNVCLCDGPIQVLKSDYQETDEINEFITDFEKNIKSVCQKEIKIIKTDESTFEANNIMSAKKFLNCKTPLSGNFTFNPNPPSTEQTYPCLSKPATVISGCEKSIQLLELKSNVDNNQKDAQVFESYDFDTTTPFIERPIKNNLPLPEMQKNCKKLFYSKVIPQNKQISQYFKKVKPLQSIRSEQNQQGSELATEKASNSFTKVNKKYNKLFPIFSSQNLYK